MNQTIKAIQEAMIKTNKCLSIINQLIDRIPDDEIKKCFYPFKEQFENTLKSHEKALKIAKDNLKAKGFSVE